MKLFKMTTILLVLFFSIIGTAWSGVIINTNTTWPVDDYYLLDTVYVQDGATFTLQEGTSILFERSMIMVVEDGSTLNATRVRFRSVSVNTPNFDYRKSGGITFRESGTEGYLNHCVFDNVGGRVDGDIAEDDTTFTVVSRENAAVYVEACSLYGSIDTDDFFVVTTGGYMELNNVQAYWLEHGSCVRIQDPNSSIDIYNSYLVSGDDASQGAVIEARGGSVKFHGNGNRIGPAGGTEEKDRQLVQQHDATIDCRHIWWGEFPIYGEYHLVKPNDVNHIENIKFAPPQ